MKIIKNKNVYKKSKNKIEYDENYQYLSQYLSKSESSKYSNYENSPEKLIEIVSGIEDCFNKDLNNNENDSIALLSYDELS